jgi:hypothetical protein
LTDGIEPDYDLTEEQEEAIEYFAENGVHQDVWKKVLNEVRG